MTFGAWSARRDYLLLDFFVYFLGLRDFLHKQSFFPRRVCRCEIYKDLSSLAKCCACYIHRAYGLRRQAHYRSVGDSFNSLSSGTWCQHLASDC